MVRKRKVTIVQTREVTVVGSMHRCAAFCFRCSKFSRTVELAEAVVLRNGNEEALNEWLKAGVVHFAGDAACNLLCLDSLIAAVASSDQAGHVRAIERSSIWDG